MARFKFPHKAPEGFYYEQTQFKRNVVAIWIHFDRNFDYNNGKHTRSIWGFLNTKTGEYHAPVNSSTVGSVVKPEDTTPYSAMQIKKTILESFFQ